MAVLRLFGKNLIFEQKCYFSKKLIFLRLPLNMIFHTDFCKPTQNPLVVYRNSLFRQQDNFKKRMKGRKIGAAMLEVPHRKKRVQNEGRFWRVLGEIDLKNDLVRNDPIFQKECTYRVAGAVMMILSIKWEMRGRRDGGL